MLLKWLDKDPEETRDFGITWLKALGADTIATSTWAFEGDGGLVEVLNSKTLNTTTIRLSGGTINTEYVCTNHIVTAGNQILEQSVLLRVRAK